MYKTIRGIVQEMIENDTTLYIRECSICRCPYGYYSRAGNLYFTSNCNCGAPWEEPREVEVSDLIKFLEENIDNDYIKYQLGVDEIVK